MSKLMTTLILASVLVGCATQKPQMPEDKYAGFARGWAVVHLCASSERMATSDAASGHQYLVYAMNAYSFDGARMDSEAKYQIQNGINPTDEACRLSAVAIQSKKQQIESNTVASNQQQQPGININKPTNTYCNKIGTQVLCSSF